MPRHQLRLLTVAQRKRWREKDSQQMRELLQKVKKQLRRDLGRVAGQRRQCWQQQSQSHQMRVLLALEVTPKKLVELQTLQYLMTAEPLAGCL